MYVQFNLPDSITSKSLLQHAILYFFFCKDVQGIHFMNHSIDSIILQYRISIISHRQIKNKQKIIPLNMQYAQNWKSISLLLLVMMQSNIKLTIHLKPLNIKLDYVFVLTNWAFFPVLYDLACDVYVGVQKYIKTFGHDKTYLKSCTKYQKNNWQR